MKTQYETRKRQIIKDAKIDKNDVPTMRARLDRFVTPFFKHFRRSESRNNAAVMLKGLLSDLKRKNTESIAYRFGQKARALQLFVGSADWDHQVVLERIASEVVKLIGEDDAILAFDPSAFEKDGKNSAGVARQYLGRYGKVDNGQVGTFLAYVTRTEHILVNGKLFIPEEWNDDPQRCEKARIPKKEYENHKTRHEHCLEMLDEQGELLPHQWAAGDDEPGKSSSFRRELRKRNEKHILAVPSDTNVRDLNDVPEYKGRGTPQKGAFVRVDKLKQKLTDADLETIDIRDGEKGPLVIKLAVFHVLAKTERGEHGSGESERLLIAERPKGAGVQYDYYFSNAADGTTYEEFARVILSSHRVEDCFRRAKSECGLADYEVQSWIGWHHHVTLCLLASWFLTQETLRGKKRITLADGADQSRADRRADTPLRDANVS